jgi:signal transduction histidine kinase
VGRRRAGTSPGVTEEAHGGELKVELPPDLTAAREARAATKRVLPRWRLAALLDPVLLVVSELVGNAVRHGRPPVDLRLRKAGQGVRVAVHDDEAAPPTAVEATRDAESGRGLLLVDALASESGVEQIEGDGKVVWARVDPEPDGG